MGFIFVLVACLGCHLASASVSPKATVTYEEKIIVNASELCIIPVRPSHFNWTIKPDFVGQIKYNPRISQAPDLPEWLRYTYTMQSSVGYIYGVPPKKIGSLNLDVMGWKQDDYDVRRLVVSMEVNRKDPLEFVVEMKIDNLNVRDMCDPRRMNRLLKVFKDELGWTMRDGGHVVPSFMGSAVDEGENRRPVRPDDAEGVIVHLSSDQDFGDSVKKLALEVSKLWKMRPCPRDMKRTSVERHFRKHSFQIDWCFFRLRTVEGWEEDYEDQVTPSEVTPAPEHGHHEHGSHSVYEEDDNSEMKDDTKPGVTAGGSKSEGPTSDVFVFKQQIPERGYGWAALLACVIPGSIGGLVGFLLIALLWADRDDDAPIDEDALCFEAAYRFLMSIFDFKWCNRMQDDKDWEQEVMRGGENVVFVAQPDDRDIFDQLEDERFPTPLPPQYHPNGSPALTYAV